MAGRLGSTSILWIVGIWSCATRMCPLATTATRPVQRERLMYSSHATCGQDEYMRATIVDATSPDHSAAPWWRGAEPRVAAEREELARREPRVARRGFGEAARPAVHPCGQHLRVDAAREAPRAAAVGGDAPVGLSLVHP